MKNRYRRTYRSGISTKRLILVGSLLFGTALGVSATSTYAWYSIQERFRVTGLSMTLDYDPMYLQVGKREADGSTTYKTDEKGELVPYTLEDFGQQDIKLGNISNMFHGDYAYGKQFTPYFYSGYSPGGSKGKTAEASKDTYVQMEFNVTAPKNALLYLNPASEAVPNEPENSKAAIAHDKDFAELQNVTNAARVSFYSYSRGGHPFYNIAELGEHEEVSYAGPLDLMGLGRYDVNAENEEIIYGEVGESSLVYTAPLSEDIVVNPKEKRNVFNSTHQAPHRMLDEEKSDIRFAKEDAKPLSEFIYDETPGEHPIPIAALPAGEETRVVVSIFLEGWDHDMTEALAYASFDFSLGFVAVFDEAADQYL